MNEFHFIALFISLTAVAAYVNARFLKLPATVGLMIVALVISGILLLLNSIGIDIAGSADDFFESISFSEVLMQGMLSFLLFAGALHINLNDLAKQKFIVGSLATLGVVASTFMVGTATWLVLGWLDFRIPYLYCLVFGSLISPTDPVAVLAILKSAGASKSLSTKIAGESLFNDGVGVVVFMVLVGLATGGQEPSLSHVALLFAEEALGGIVFGVVLGYIGYLLLKDIDNYSVEVLITLAMVSGGYALAMAIHTSGPIAVVVAGLLIGNHGRRLAMSETTRKHLDVFWELIDETLNAILFVWIGLEILVLHFELSYLWAGLIAIPVALLSRFVAVKTAVTILRRRRAFSNNAEYILTWGGLRGGISIALALSLAAGPTRDLIVSMTYIIVIFSILVQGLSIKKLVQVSAEAPE